MKSRSPKKSTCADSKLTNTSHLTTSIPKIQPFFNKKIKKAKSFGPKFNTERISSKQAINEHIPDSSDCQGIFASLSKFRGSTNNFTHSFDSLRDNQDDFSGRVHLNTRTSQVARAEDRFYRDEEEYPIIGRHFLQE